MTVGVEIGASKLQVIATDRQGKIHRTLRHEVEQGAQAGDILQWTEQAIHSLQKDCSEPLEGIGVGFGGIVSRQAGTTLLSVQVPGWEQFPLRDFYQTAFSLPCVVENDTVCGGLAEYLLGSGRGTQGFFYTNIGSGIGGALFDHGRLILGQDLGCAYFGHTYVPSWEEPNVPQKVENLCSGFAIEKRLNREGYVSADSALSRLSGGGRLTCKHLGQAAQQGDAFALAEIDRVAHSLGIGLANVLALLHPERIAIGGGVSNLGEVLLEPMRRYAKQYAFEPCKEGFEILRCRFTEEAVPLGAAMLIV